MRRTMFALLGALALGACNGVLELGVERTPDMVAQSPSTTPGPTRIEQQATPLTVLDPSRLGSACRSQAHPEQDPDSTVVCFVDALLRGADEEAVAFLDPELRTNLASAETPLELLLGLQARPSSARVLGVSREGESLARAEVILVVGDAVEHRTLTLNVGAEGWRVAAVDGVTDLVVEEYAIVSEEEDTPNHLEYLQRIEPSILDRRRAWREPPAEEVARAYNAALAPFDYLLVPRETPGWSSPFYDLYRGGEVVAQDIEAIWPVSVASSGQDFAFLVQGLNRPAQLVRRRSLQPWDTARHCDTPPVFAGDDLIFLERDDQHRECRLRRGDAVLFSFQMSGPRPDNPVKGLWSWEGRWVLEIDGQVFIDGTSLSQQSGYESVFGWRLLAGRPLYFFEDEDGIGVSYSGQVLPHTYDEVVHDRCCEPAAFNVGGNAHMVWFHGLRDGLWYYVEMGMYE